MRALRRKAGIRRHGRRGKMKRLGARAVGAEVDERGQRAGSARDGRGKADRSRLTRPAGIWVVPGKPVFVDIRRDRGGSDGLRPIILEDDGLGDVGALCDVVAVAI
ncbi:hypothetical protein, partial [Mesorhizobium sp. B261B1A]|uniref:hypothetical protein n=1 Tax=Mesorhizobium sp. B261B1A TaxID=2876671 RepID=UPI00398C6420